jgi:hypothetical protein
LDLLETQNIGRAHVCDDVLRNQGEAASGQIIDNFKIENVVASD